MLSIRLDQVRILLDLPDNLIDQRFLLFQETQMEAATPVRGTIQVQLAEPEAFELHLSEEPEKVETDFASTKIYRDCICCLFKEQGGWLGLVVQDGQVLCVPDQNIEYGAEQAAVLFDYMKGGVFLLLRKYGYYVLHSSSLILNGKALAFSAESGVGKTTHTQFWEKLYHTPLFNGDMLMIDRCADLPKAIGIPWSGSTGITTKGSLPLAGVFFLERGKKNEVRETVGLEKLILLTQRMLSVNYDHKAFLENAGSLERTAQSLKCARLVCRPDEDAARTAYRYAHDNGWIQE